MNGIVNLQDLRATDASEFGAKAANLGELMSIGMKVPSGIALSANVHETYMTESGMAEIVKKFTSDIQDADIQKMNFISSRLMQIAQVNPRVKDNQKKLKTELDTRLLTKNIYAVRSSAIGEDSESASFAGQHDTYLGLRASMASHYVMQCYKSLYEARAFSYRIKNGVGIDNLNMGVVIQEMIKATSSGVMFTRDPLTGEHRIVIEAVLGVGEGLVSGKYTPDRFVVENNKVVSHDKVAQHSKIASTSKREAHTITVKDANAVKLSEKQAIRLAGYGAKIEKHFGEPMDIEWARHGNTLYILQARPVTTKKQEIADKLDLDIVCTGMPASVGIGTGAAISIAPNLSTKDIIALIKPGDVLVTDMTTPDFVPVFDKISALVTMKGGATCHAAIVSREMNVPCVVGVGEIDIPNALQVTVDGGNGIVHKAA